MVIFKLQKLLLTVIFLVKRNQDGIPVKLFPTAILNPRKLAFQKVSENLLNLISR